MTEALLRQALQSQDEFGGRLAARLESGTAELPHEVSERLRAARMRALGQRKLGSLQPAMTAGHAGGVAVLGSGPGEGERHPWWQGIASALPLLALAAGLVTIHVVQNDRRASELAEVDAALLTDALPPSAYADPGFVQFLKSGQ